MLPNLRELFLGNWRNKGVALFFAGIIWYVAFQSELRTDDVHITVDLLPQQPDKVIISKEFLRGDNQLARYTGDMIIKVQGTRKQIDNLPKALLGRIQVKIDASAENAPGGAARKRYYFSAKDFAPLDPNVVGILSFTPEYVDLVFDDRAEREVTVVTNISIPAGFEKESESIEPSIVKITGPRSVIDKVQLVAEVGSIDAGSRRFEGEMALQPRFPDSIDENVIKSTVKWTAKLVKIGLQLRYRQDSISEEAVRVRFILPPMKFPVQIKFDESSIPIVFRGPEREIQYLKEKIKEPDFFLGVKVPEAELSSRQEHTFTFSEDQLILFGFSREIQKLQHQKRKGLVSWTYTIVPVPAGE